VTENAVCRQGSCCCALADRASGTALQQGDEARHTRHTCTASRCRAVRPTWRRAPRSCANVVGHDARARHAARRVASRKDAATWPSPGSAPHRDGCPDTGVCTARVRYTPSPRLLPALARDTEAGAKQPTLSVETHFSSMCSLAVAAALLGAQQPSRVMCLRVPLCWPCCCPLGSPWPRGLSGVAFHSFLISSSRRQVSGRAHRRGR